MHRIGTAGMFVLFAVGAFIVLLGGSIAAYNESFFALGACTVFALPFVGAAVALMIGEEKAEQRLEKSKIENWEREQRRLAAIPPGAAPGQLSEMPPATSAGNLSVPEEQGAVSIARKQAL